MSNKKRVNWMGSREVRHLNSQVFSLGFEQIQTITHPDGQSSCLAVFLYRVLTDGVGVCFCFLLKPELRRITRFLERAQKVNV